MERSWFWRLLLVLGLLALAVYYSIPSGIYFFSDPDVRRDKEKLAEAIPDWLPKHRFNLGIDLQGGLHLVMGVDTDKAIQDRADRVADEIVEAMQEKNIALQSCRREGDAPEIHIVMKSAGDWETLKTHLEYREDTWTVRSHLGTDVIFGMKADQEALLRDDVVAQAQKTVQNRIDTFGVKEAEVRRRGDSSILIQVAGLTAQDQEVIKNDIIGRTAQLEFKIVDETSDYFSQLANKADKPASVSLQMDTYEGKDGLVTRPYLEGTARDELKAFLAKYPPPSDRVVGVQEFKENQNAKPVFHSWLLERRTPITGDALTDAFVAFDNEQNSYYVAMKFDRKGAVIFEKLTRENTKRKMAIVLDDVVDSAPVIQGPIPGGNAQITLGGYKSQEEIMADARALSVVLKAGALPAPLYPQEQRTVGATLGDDAVSKGKAALFFAGLLVVLLMLGYYRLSGAVGSTALAANLLFLFATLAAFDATLTLPGIAGLALTIGMAVDANIIQFERIREELRAGKTSRAALDGGFGKAFSAIFDANVTTFLAAVVLLQYGSGPIRGFATTLALGVLINTFTAVVVPKLLLDWYVRTMRPSQISI
jgi:preprotein translocase subunit SecD